MNSRQERTPFITIGGDRFPIPRAIQDALLELYRAIERETPLLTQNGCRACGECCNFGEWGHELRVTQFELAAMVRAHGLRRPTGNRPDVCPYLTHGKCQARATRTLGCRVFFCGAREDASERLYERCFGRLRRLARELGVEIYYGELLRSLAEVEIGSSQEGQIPQTRP